jgi:hypothetical protein
MILTSFPYFYDTSLPIEEVEKANKLLLSKTALKLFDPRK